MPKKIPKKIVIVGGGFAGLNAAKGLANHSGFDVTLIDARNHHLFQPLLYQVATAGLSPADIATPLRAVFSNAHNVHVFMDTVLNIDPIQKLVQGKNHVYPYDKVILACGSKHSYFGNNHWEEFAPGLKTLEQAIEIRRRILNAFEQAELETDPIKQNALLTFVVVGGGPTGVELAGAIGEISRYTLSKNFSHIDPRRTRIILVEGSGRLLGAFNQTLSASSTRELEALGVSVWTHKTVTNIDAEGIQIGGEKIASRTVLWAAGVRPAELTQTLTFPKDKAGRILVEKDLSVPGQSDIFVLGDQANFSHQGPTPLPGLCPVAIQMGEHVAYNLKRESLGKSRLPFSYLNKGIMATVGRGYAIAEIPGGLKLTGLIGWLAWLLIHILYLIGFKNRISVFIQWAWSFITFKRGARLITGTEWREFKVQDASPKN